MRSGACESRGVRLLAFFPVLAVQGGSLGADKSSDDKLPDSKCPVVTSRPTVIMRAPTASGATASGPAASGAAAAQFINEVIKSGLERDLVAAYQDVEAVREEMGPLHSNLRHTAVKKYLLLLSAKHKVRELEQDLHAVSQPLVENQPLVPPAGMDQSGRPATGERAVDPVLERIMDEECPTRRPCRELLEMAETELLVVIQQELQNHYNKAGLGLYEDCALQWACLSVRVCTILAGERLERLLQNFPLPRGEEGLSDAWRLACLMDKCIDARQMPLLTRLLHVEVTDEFADRGRVYRTGLAHNMRRLAGSTQSRKQLQAASVALHWTQWAIARQISKPNESVWLSPRALTITVSLEKLLGQEAFADLAALCRRQLRLRESRPNDFNLIGYILEKTPLVAEPVPSVGPALPVGLAPSVEPALPVGLAPSVEPALPVGLAPSVEPALYVGLAPSVEPALPVGLAPSVEPTLPVGLAPSEEQEGRLHQTTEVHEAMDTRDATQETTAPYAMVQGVVTQEPTIQDVMMQEVPIQKPSTQVSRSAFKRPGAASSWFPLKKLILEREGFPPGPSSR